jgi:NTP pyrophosphatase (non-canonical NTP hydrolase)
MNLETIRAVNVERAQRWHKGFPYGDDDWSGADWSNAMCGEVGEAANVVKKIRRLETGTMQIGEPELEYLRQQLGHEIADVILYADLLAAYYGIDLASVITQKFNLVSEKYGFPERL